MKPGLRPVSGTETSFLCSGSGSIRDTVTTSCNSSMVSAWRKSSSGCGRPKGVVYQDEILALRTPGRPICPVWAVPHNPAHEVPIDNDPLKRRRLTKHAWNSLARIAVQITQAVRAAHLDSIVHNDIKPGNVLLDHDGRVWVRISDCRRSFPRLLMAAACIESQAIRWQPVTPGNQ